MAYVSPTSRASLAKITASIWNQDVVENTKSLAENRPHCRVYNSSAISIANSSNVVVTYNSERYDVGGLHSTSSNTGRLTAPITGTYSIGGAVVWASAASGLRAAWIQLNGSTRIAENDALISSATEYSQSLHTEWLLNAGDYVEIGVFQTSGAALSLQAYAGRSMEFYMSLIAPS